MKAIQQAMEQLKAAKDEIAKIQAQRDAAEKTVRAAHEAVKAVDKLVNPFAAKTMNEMITFLLLLLLL